MLLNRYRLCFRFTLLGLILLIGLRSLATATVKGQAILSLPEVAVDIGNVGAEETLKVDFAVRNMGDRRLVINQIGQACGCEEAGTTLCVSPGHSGHLTVVLETGLTEGQIERVTDFSTNDPSHPTFSLKLRAYVDHDDPRAE